MWKRTMLTAATIIGVGVVMGVIDTPAQAGTVLRCQPNDLVLKQLQTQYNEKPIARALMHDGKFMMEVTRNEDGAFTVLVTNANGQTCIVATGQNWTDVKAIPVGSGVSYGGEWDGPRR